jgi:hypothetical protein
LRQLRRQAPEMTLLLPVPHANCQLPISYICTHFGRLLPFFQADQKNVFFAGKWL